MSTINQQPKKKSVTLFYLGVMLVIIFPVVGWYTYQQVLGNTNINTTITTNPDLENGLVGHWTFDGKDMDWGSTTAEARDRSGNGNSGNVTNFTSTSTRPGKIGQALEFDGGDDHVDVNSLSITEDNITVSAWVKGRDFSSPAAGINGIVGGSSGAASDHSIILRAGDTNPADNQIQLVIYENGDTLHGSANKLNGTTFLNTDEWYHVVGVYDSTGRGAIYINGVLDVENNSLGNGTLQNNSGGIEVGRENTDNDRVWKGTIDDVRIYNRALSAEEVTRLYELGATTHLNTTITTNDELENGLIGHWTFDGKDMDWGSTTAEVRDRSGNGNHGDAVSLVSTSTRPGRIGQALEFDGSDDHVSIDDDVSLDFGSTFTASAWVKWEGGSVPGSQWPRIFSKKNAWNSGSGWHFSLQSADNDAVNIQGSGSTERVIHNCVDSWANAEWHHLTVVYSGSNAELYCDGESKGSGSINTVIDNNEELVIGRESGSGLYRWNGLIDEARVYNRALSAEEITRLYELGATTHINTSITTNPDLETGLVGHWTFDGKDMDWGSTTAEARDRSGQSNHGNAISLVSTSTRPGKIGQALETDGNNDYIILPEALKITSYPVSVALWVNPITGDTSNDRFFLVTTERGQYNGYSVGITPTNNVWTMASGNTTSCTGGGRRDQSTDTTPIVRGAWQHVVVVFDGEDSRRVYVNGVSQTLASFSGTGGGSALAYLGGVDVVIGSTPNNGCSVAEYSNSKLDDVRIYNRALSADEVARLYELGK